MRLRKLNELCEEWSDFDGSYLVGDDGYIYHEISECFIRRLKSGYYRSGKRYGYQQVRGYFGTHKQHTIKVHRAVALAFVPRREGANDVDHINHDKTDNRFENLQWLTHHENILRMQERKKVIQNEKGKTAYRDGSVHPWNDGSGFGKSADTYSDDRHRRMALQRSMDAGRVICQ